MASLFQRPFYSMLLSLIFFILSFISSTLAQGLRIVPLSHTGSDILVPCSFDDQEGTCLLDTGSDLTIVDPQSFQHYLPATDSRHFRLSNEASPIGQLIHFREIHIDDFALRHHAQIRRSQPSSLDELPFFSYRTPFHQQSSTFLLGRIGINSFLNQKILFDFNENRISKFDEFPENTNVFTLERTRNDRILIPTHFMGNSFLSFFDTGFSLSAIDSNIYRHYRNYFEIIDTVRVISPLSEETSALVVRANRGASLEINGIELSGVYFLVKDLSSIAQELGLPHINLVLGSNVISRMNWYLDLVNNRGLAL